MRKEVKVSAFTKDLMMEVGDENAAREFILEQERYDVEIQDYQQRIYPLQTRNAELGRQTFGTRTEINYQKELKSREAQHVTNQLEIAKKYGIEAKAHQVAEKHGYNQQEVNVAFKKQLDTFRVQEKESVPAMGADENRNVLTEEKSQQDLAAERMIKKMEKNRPDKFSNWFSQSLTYTQLQNSSRSGERNNPSPDLQKDQDGIDMDRDE